MLGRFVYVASSLTVNVYADGLLIVNGDVPLAGLPTIKVFDAARGMRSVLLGRDRSVLRERQANDACQGGFIQHKGWVTRCNRLLLLGDQGLVPRRERLPVPCDLRQGLLSGRLMTRCGDRKTTGIRRMWSGAGLGDESIDEGCDAGLVAFNGAIQLKAFIECGEHGARRRHSHAQPLADIFIVRTRPWVRCA